MTEDELKRIEHDTMSYGYQSLSQADVLSLIAALRDSRKQFDAMLDNCANAEVRAKRMESAIKSILWLDACNCMDAYTKRGMHGPNEICGELDPLRAALKESE